MRKPAIFDDIAQEAISLCRQSLIAAAETMVSRSAVGAAAPPKPASTPAPASQAPQQDAMRNSVGRLDGHLFLVRHLLILKEIAHNLDEGKKTLENEVVQLRGGEGVGRRAGQGVMGGDFGGGGGVAGRSLPQRCAMELTGRF